MSLLRTLHFLEEEEGGVGGVSRRLTSASFHGTFPDILAGRADDGWPRPLQAANGTFPLNLPLILANVAGLDCCEGTGEGARLLFCLRRRLIQSVKQSLQ